MDIDNCSLSFSATAVHTQENLLKEMVVSPNPNNGEFDIKPNDTESFSYFIYDACGKLVQSGNSDTEKVKITLLTKGIYILKLKYGTHENTRRVVVTN